VGGYSDTNVVGARWHRGHGDNAAGGRWQHMTFSGAQVQFRVEVSFLSFLFFY